MQPGGREVLLPCIHGPVDEKWLWKSSWRHHRNHYGSGYGNTGYLPDGGKGHYAHGSNEHRLPPAAHAGDGILLKIYVESITRTLIHMRAEAMNEAQPDKLCVTASGVFFVKML